MEQKHFWKICFENKQFIWSDQPWPPLSANVKLAHPSALRACLKVCKVGCTLCILMLLELVLHPTLFWHSFEKEPFALFISFFSYWSDHGRMGELVCEILSSKREWFSNQTCSTFSLNVLYRKIKMARTHASLTLTGELWLK